MDIKRIINETLKVNEDEVTKAAMNQIKYESESPATETPAAPVDQGAEEKAEVPEITPELVDQLIKEIPELEGIDPAQLVAGMQAEMEHFESVAKNIQLIAKIAADHIREYAGKDYYAALAQMEHELSETPEEEKVEHAEGGEEGPAAEEVPAGEEAPVEEKKKKEDKKEKEEEKK